MTVELLTRHCTTKRGIRRQIGYQHNELAGRDVAAPEIGDVVTPVFSDQRRFDRVWVFAEE